MTFDLENVVPLLDFLRRAEGLKSTLRSTWMRDGRQESAAEHSWRLALFAMLASKEYPQLDVLKILQLSIVHDLGETINGDIPAPEQTGEKNGQEREDLIDLLRPLPEDMQQEILALWEEYEAASTPEAKLVKALDKLETLLQQTQGANPASFNYAFNLTYGEKYTGLDAFVKELRAVIDGETEACLVVKSNSIEAGN